MSAKLAGLNETPSETSDCKIGQTFSWCADVLCFLTDGTQTPVFDFSSLLKSFCAEQCELRNARFRGKSAYCEKGKHRS
jgi:hypothetical protein